MRNSNLFFPLTRHNFIGVGVYNACCKAYDWREPIQAGVVDSLILYSVFNRPFYRHEKTRFMDNPCRIVISGLSNPVLSDIFCGMLSRELSLSTSRILEKRDYPKNWEAEGTVIHSSGT